LKKLKKRHPSNFGVGQREEGGRGRTRGKANRRPQVIKIGSPRPKGGREKSRHSYATTFDWKGQRENGPQLKRLLINNKKMRKMGAALGRQLR